MSYTLACILEVVPKLSGRVAFSWFHLLGCCPYIYIYAIICIYLIYHLWPTAEAKHIHKLTGGTVERVFCRGPGFSRALLQLRSNAGILHRLCVGIPVCPLPKKKQNTKGCSLGFSFSAATLRKHCGYHGFVHVAVLAQHRKTQCFVALFMLKTHPHQHPVSKTKNGKRLCARKSSAQSRHACQHQCNRSLFRYAKNECNRLLNGERLPCHDLHGQATWFQRPSFAKVLQQICPISYGCVFLQDPSKNGGFAVAFSLKPQRTGTMPSQGRVLHFSSRRPLAQRTIPDRSQAYSWAAQNGLAHLTTKGTNWVGQSCSN